MTNNSSGNSIFQIPIVANGSRALRIENPRIKDITDDVRAQRVFPTDSISSRIKYYGFDSIPIADEKLIALPSNNPYVCKIEAKTVASILSDKFSIQDKVEQRAMNERLNDETTIFQNPEYFDLRRAMPHIGQPRLYKFVPADFSNFPVDEILESIGKRRFFIFENSTDGFCIQTNKSGIVISSKNPAVQQTIERTKHIDDPRERIERFLTTLSENKYSITKITLGAWFPAMAKWLEGKTPSTEGVAAWIRDLIQKEFELVDHILQLPGNFYLKSSRKANGFLVIRIKKTEDGFVIESDSPEFEPIKIAMSETYVNILDRIQKLKKYPAYFDAVKELEERAVLFEQNPRNLLRYLLWFIPYPILEREIVGETVNEKRVEFRIICKRDHCDPEFNIPGHFAKVSGNSVAANISLGGEEKLILGQLTDLYTEKLFSPEEAERIKELPIDKKPEVVVNSATESLFELMLLSLTYANAYYDLYLQDLLETYDTYTINKKINALLDFAIDLIPVWDEKTMRLDYYLLEIQHGYGFSIYNDLGLDHQNHFEEWRGNKQREAQMKSRSKISRSTPNKGGYSDRSFSSGLLNDTKLS